LLVSDPSLYHIGHFRVGAASGYIGSTTITITITITTTITITITGST